MQSVRRFEIFLLMSKFFSKFFCNIKAISSFHHDSPQAISFKIGDRLELKEECDGFYF